MHPLEVCAWWSITCMTYTITFFPSFPFSLYLHACISSLLSINLFIYSQPLFLPRSFITLVLFPLSNCIIIQQICISVYVFSSFFLWLIPPKNVLLNLFFLDLHNISSIRLRYMFLSLSTALTIHSFSRVPLYFSIYIFVHIPFSYYLPTCLLSLICDLHAPLWPPLPILIPRLNLPPLTEQCSLPCSLALSSSDAPLLS